MKKSLIILLLALVMCFCSAAAENTGVLGQPFPDFSAEDTEGKTFTLSEALKDHEAVLLNIWATWCPPCEGEFPDLNAVYEKYGDRVAFIALSCENNDTLPVIEEFRKSHGITFPMGRDEDSKLSNYLQVMGIPTTVIIDRFGNAAFMRSGAFTNAAEITRLVEAFLGENYQETKVLNEIPRDTATRAYPVSVARAIRVENEGARKVILQAEGYDEDFTGYVLKDKTARLRLDVAAGDDPTTLVYYDGLNGEPHDLVSLLNRELNVYVYEQELQEEDYITAELIDPSLSDDANFCYLFLFSGEEAIEKLITRNRGAGTDVTWHYDETPAAEQKTAEAYVLRTIDQDGKPVPGVMVNFCTDAACNTQVSDDRGMITVSGAPENYHVQLLKVPEGYSFDEGFEMNTGTAYGEWVLRIRKN